MASWFDFLRIEADLAMTFIHSAEIHTNPENSVVSLGNARKALAQINRGLMRPASYGLGKDEVLFLAQRCTQIEKALEIFRISN